MPLILDPNGCIEYTPLYQIDKRECVGNSVDSINYNINQIDLTFERIFGWCSRESVDCVSTIFGCVCGEPTPLSTGDGFIYGDGNTVCFLSSDINCGVPVKSGGDYEMIECGEPCTFLGVNASSKLEFMRLGIPKTIGMAANGEYGHLLRFTETDATETIDLSTIVPNYPDTTTGCCSVFPVKAFVTAEMQDKGDSDSVTLLRINDWEIQGGRYTGPYTTAPYPMEVILRDQKYLDITIRFSNGTSKAKVWVWLNKIQTYC